MGTNVTAIIPTFNNELTLAACVRSLQSQTAPPDEILVVDCGSTDSTARIAASVATLVHSPVANRCYQNNLGARVGAGEFLLFLDADMVVSGTVIEEALAIAVASPTPIALVVPEVSRGATYWARVKAFERSFYSGVWWLEALRWLPRDAFFSLGGFDTTMMGTEDWDLDERVRSALPVQRVRSPIYHEEGELRLRALAARKGHYAAAFARFTDRHPHRARLALRIAPRAQLFLRHPARMARHPVLSLGVAAMGLTEIAATRGWYRTQSPWPNERPVPSPDEGSSLDAPASMHTESSL